MYFLYGLLFQEAFKAIEEIHNLLELSGKTPRPGLLDNYYSRQVKVYWMANNKLFHAAALHKLFVLWKEQKKSILPEDLQKLVNFSRGFWLLYHVCLFISGLHHGCC